jgi:uncharacterized membrane protein
MTPVAWLLLSTGIAGAVYTLIALRRARRQTGYQPVWEDWLWHTILPLIAYVTLIGAAAALPLHAVTALFLVAAVALLLIFIGIHNAWDTVAFVAMHHPPTPRE